MKSSLLLSILTLIILFGIIACRKNLMNEALDPDQKSVDVNVAAAKKWYYETFKKSAEWTSYTSARNRTSGTNAQKEPDWEHGTYNKLGNLEITEFPLFRSSTSFSLPAASLTDEEKMKIAKASLSRIAFIKNDKNIITVRVIDYIPEWQYLKKKNFDISNVMYGKPGDDFTGRIFIKNWNDDILSLRMIENGKVTKKGSIKKSTTTDNRLARLAPGGEGCQPMQVCIWRQDCVEWYYGETFSYEDCSSWYNTGNCWIEDYCNDGGGSTGNNDDCNGAPAPATARIEGSTTNESTGTTTVEPCPCEFYGTCAKIDCAGVENGTAYIAPCGCIGGTTGIKQCPETPCPTNLADMKLAFPSADTNKLKQIINLINTFSGVFGIDNKLKLQHFVAQAAVETAQFTNLNKGEKLNYTTAARLIAVWPSRFSLTNPKLKNPYDYLNNPEKLANNVYGNRKDLGNGSEASGDGWNFRGRGLMHLTGRNGYTKFKTFYNNTYQANIDPVSDPDIISSNMELNVVSALWYFKNRVLARGLDENTSTETVSVRVNGGTTGLDERVASTERAMLFIKCN